MTTASPLTQKGNPRVRPELRMDGGEHGHVLVTIIDVDGTRLTADVPVGFVRGLLNRAAPPPPVHPAAPELYRAALEGIIAKASAHHHPDRCSPRALCGYCEIAEAAEAGLMGVRRAVPLGAV